MIPEAIIAMLACVRIGAIHSVVFAGFSRESLAGRINDAKPKLLLTCDAGSRMGKIVKLKEIVDDAIDQANVDLNVILFNRRLDPDINWVEDRDFDWMNLLENSKEAFSVFRIFNRRQEIRTILVMKTYQNCVNQTWINQKNIPPQPIENQLWIL